MAMQRPGIRRRLPGNSAPARPARGRQVRDRGESHGDRLPWMISVKPRRNVARPDRQFGPGLDRVHRLAPISDERFRALGEEVAE